MHAMHRLAVASLVAVAGLCSTVSAGILVNEGFEAQTLGTTYGSGDGDPITGWNFYPLGGWGGVSVDTAAKDGMVGSNYLSIQFGGIETGSASRPSVVGGQSVALSLLYASDGAWTPSHVYLDFFDAASASVGSPIEVLTLPASGSATSFQRYTAALTTVPEGATSFGIRVVSPAIWSPGIHLDDVQVSVPEPASLGLLGGAALMLCRRNRKARA